MTRLDEIEELLSQRHAVIDACDHLCYHVKWLVGKLRECQEYIQCHPGCNGPFKELRCTCGAKKFLKSLKETK